MADTPNLAFWRLHPILLYLLSHPLLATQLLIILLHQIWLFFWNLCCPLGCRGLDVSTFLESVCAKRRRSERGRDEGEKIHQESEKRKLASGFCFFLQRFSRFMSLLFWVLPCAAACAIFLRCPVEQNAAFSFVGREIAPTYPHLPAYPYPCTEYNTLRVDRGPPLILVLPLDGVPSLLLRHLQSCRVDAIAYPYFALLLRSFTSPNWPSCLLSFVLLFVYVPFLPACLPTKIPWIYSSGSECPCTYIITCALRACIAR